MNQEAIKILVVDDEHDIREILQYNLLKQGYDVFLAEDGREAVKKAQKIRPDLILLDYMMPIMDGVEACKKIRNITDLHNASIVFLTARSDDISEIIALKAGADDYITKPIRPNVLIARIDALLRRRMPEKSLPVIHDVLFDDIKIYVDKHMVVFENQEIYLPKKEFRLLALLASEPNKVFSRDDIFSFVWGNDIVVGNRTIDVHVRKLREKLHDRFIKTIKGVGYTFSR